VLLPERSDNCYKVSPTNSNGQTNLGYDYMIFNRIFVLGSGAVGSTYGALLSKKEDVTLIGRKAHVDAINSNGLFLACFGCLGLGWV